MRFRLWRPEGLATKLFLGFFFLSLLPITVMSALSLGHLQTIQAISVEETRALLVSAEIKRLKERLNQEAGRLAGVFARLEDEAHSLRVFGETLLAEPSRFSYRNGSRYAFGPDGSYGNPDDGNSVLFLPRPRPALLPLAAATESLDLVMRPLAEREPRMVLAWVIVREGVTRAYPWRDFSHMPRDKDYTTWPFYYLADPEHDPDRGEVFTAPYLDPLSDEWMISCLSPIYVAGEHRATAGIDITIEKLLREIGEIRFSPTSGSLLLAGTGVIAASGNLDAAGLGLDPGRPLHGQDLADSTSPAVGALARRIRERPESVDLLDTRGLRAFTAYAAVDPPGWSLVLMVPEADVIGPAHASAREVRAETQRIRSNFIHILIFAVLGVVAITALVLVHQSRGLRALLTGIQRLGRGDLRHRLVEGTDEFGRLAHALNTMAGSLLDQKRELKRVYGEVEQQRKLSAVGRLAAGVAHEVNNPLATISTYTQMLMRRQDLGPEARRDLDVVMGEIRRIQEKLRSLLDLSRLQSPVKGLLDPDRLVQEVADLSRHEAAAQGIAFRLDLDGGGRTLHGDRSGLKQVLWNLLGNAIDAQDEGGEVVVRSRSVENGGRAGSYVLEVEDRGPGIPAEVLPKIFEPFFTTKEVGQGTGLGLAVAYRIVRGHGGTIEAENLDPRGCRFRVVLPREEPT